ncbi:streptophobe family protein [Streptomyces sp. P1-3]|uniref:streptophobe family protein n=1 Tax=Streptomyces sp. P1-3 TaxID=3421658 RepID=UPI003D35A0FA
MTASSGGRIPWGAAALAALTAVSWAFIAMVGVAALGLELLGADDVGALGPMTAAVVVLATGGSVTPSGDVEVFGLVGADAASAVDIAPLGVSVVGALLLGGVFLRSLRAAGAVIPLAELAVRAGAMAVLFVMFLVGLCWVGNDTVTIDGSGLGLDDAAPRDGGLLDRLPDELGDLVELGGGLLPSRIAELARAQAHVGYSVDTGPSLLGGAVWVLIVLGIALLVSRRGPLPRGWEALHRTVRPAASALCAVLLLAIGAGLATAVFAAIDDDHPALVLGAALLGAPNGVGLGVPLGLFVPWHGSATGALRSVLPDPLDDLLSTGGDRSITIGRLAELDGRVWLLVVACVLMMLAAGVLTGARTPLPPGRREPGYGFAGWCALRLGVATAVTLPLAVWLTGLSAGASLSVLGFDAFGAGIDLHGSIPLALLLGAAWGAAAGGAGALLVWVTGVAGTGASALARASEPATARVSTRHGG